MAYTRFHEEWDNLPATTTPVTAEALEHVEDGIAATAAVADAAQSGVDDLRSSVPELSLVGGPVDLTGATDATEALQGVLDAAPAGGRVVVPVGSTILLSGTVELTQPLVLEGSGSTIVGSASGTVFSIPPAASGSTFRNLRVEGLSPSTYVPGNRAFHFNGAPGAWVTGMRFEDVTCDGFGYGGFFGSHLADSTFQDCTVTNSVYAGFQFLSPRRVTLWNPTVSDLLGILKNGYMQSYPIAWTRDQSQPSIEDYPNAEDCTTWGGHISGTGWEGVDTHGGRRIRTIGTTIRGCYHGVAYVPCPDENGDDTWGPLDCVVAFCDIDSGVSDGSMGVGIQIVGAGSSGARVEAGSGVIMGNRVARYGSGLTVTETSGDPSNTAGAIRVYQTDGVKIIGNHLIEPSPFGVSLYYDNTAAIVSDNTVIDPWSDSFNTPAAVALRSSGNSVHLGSVRQSSGTKEATYVNTAGLYVSSSTNTVTFSGGHDFAAAATAFVGGLATYRQGFAGKQPAAVPSVTGSRGGNAALASLLARLSDVGLIVNNTTA